MASHRREAFMSDEICGKACREWSAGTGPVKDLYTIGDNPQFSLDVRSGGDTAAVWVLLTRHITDKDDFAENREYITVMVYKSDGKRIYYPFDPAPYVDGVRINSPHYLCKMRLGADSPRRFTLVVAQYEKQHTISYTLRVFASCAFELRPIVDGYSHQRKLTAEWRGATAGGCANYRDSFGRNAVYQLSVETAADDSRLCIELRGPKQFSVGFDFVQVSSRNNRLLPKHSSGSYRPGVCVLVLENVPAGAYNIVPTTFLPGQEGPFFLTVKSTAPVKLSKL